VFLGGAPDQAGQPRRQVRRGLVSLLLGQPRVPGDIEEDHGWRKVQPLEQAGLVQRAFHVLDQRLAPGVFLLPMVDRQGRLLGKGRYAGPQLRLRLQHLHFRHARFEEGPDDLGSVPIRFRLRDPAQAVFTDPEPPLDDDGPEPLRELELDQRHDGQLVLANLILWAGLGEPDGLPDHLQEVQGDTRPCAQLLEGRCAEQGEPIEHSHIQEGKRQRPLPDSGGDTVEWHAGPLQAPNPTRPADVTRRERMPWARFEDPELDQPVDVLGVDPGPLGHLQTRVLAHGKAIVTGVKTPVAPPTRPAALADGPMPQLRCFQVLAAMAISTIVTKIRLIVVPASTQVAFTSRLIEASRGRFVCV
jgi:hypothetical protein